MSNVHRLLPRLTVNRRLLQAVVDEPEPCCALGVVEERKQQLPVIIVGLPEVEDLAQLGDGFRLGHQVAFADGVQALRLDFAFHGLTPLQVVLDPTNDTVRHVLAGIVEGDGYFILVVGARGVTAFRSATAQEERRCFGDLLRHAKGDADAAGSKQFDGLQRALHAKQAGATRLVWLGNDDPSLLELSASHRYELRPAH